ncbi:unnamed protein product [Pleuronectes platessa]|uniref:Uncharacterized protein n=1 Tax=Pleuronectes platessa TaxID=8262 RepID=A0A9N7YPR1_PLEPL|nr:unnamed protein product [Pleuronectes platessa]
MEEELAKHLKQLADQFHGLAPVKCRELAFEYAEKNNIPVLANWTEKQCAEAAKEGPPREQRVPPVSAVAEVIRVQSRSRRPPYPAPSNGPPSLPPTDTAPRPKRKKESPRTSYADEDLPSKKNVEATLDIR